MGHCPQPGRAVKTFYLAGPAGIPRRWPSARTPLAQPGPDRAEGCIRSVDHAFSQEGGLAVLRGNIAPDGCVVKTAGVDDSLLVFEGPAHGSKTRTRRWPTSWPTR